MLVRSFLFYVAVLSVLLVNYKANADPVEDLTRVLNSSFLDISALTILSQQKTTYFGCYIESREIYGLISFVSTDYVCTAIDSSGDKISDKDFVIVNNYSNLVSEFATPFFNPTSFEEKDYWKFDGKDLCLATANPELNARCIAYAHELNSFLFDTEDEIKKIKVYCDELADSCENKLVKTMNEVSSAQQVTFVILGISAFLLLYTYFRIP